MITEYDRSKRMFWKVGDNIFYNKFEATTYAIHTKQEEKFYMFDDAYDAFDWCVEPSETWEEILKQRAMQLRDKYDYIRLWYSGGADSHTVLLTFLKNNIHIDEIFMMRHSPVDDFMFESEKEINEAAIPYIKLIKDQIPGTKITVADIGSKEYDLYNEWDFHDSGDIKFKPFACREIIKLVPQLMDSIRNKSSYCELRGFEKPRVVMENELFYSGIYDSTFSFSGIGDHSVEGFYITDDMPKVHIKQSHLLKNYIKKYYSDLDEGEINNLNKKNMDFKDHVNSSCRYPLWMPISLGKGNAAALPRKQLMILDHIKDKNNKVYDRFMSTMKNEGNGLIERFNNNNIFDGFVGIMSKKYCLGN